MRTLAGALLALVLAGPGWAQDLPLPPGHDDCRAAHAEAEAGEARATASHACAGRVIDACRAGGDANGCLSKAAGDWIQYAIGYVATARIAKGEPRPVALVEAAHGYPNLLEACPEGDFACALTALMPEMLDRMATVDAEK